MTPAERTMYVAMRNDRANMRRHLQSLSDSLLLYIDWMDTVIGPDKTIPRPISKMLGKVTGQLEMKNDLARYGALGVDYRKDDKKKAVEKLKKTAAGEVDRTRRTEAMDTREASEGSASCWAGYEIG